MGATKRLAELLTVAKRPAHGRPYVAVRFGNGPGLERQRDSDIPAAAGAGPAHHDHPCDATRYFMTIPEAVSLVLQAGSTPTAASSSSRHGRAGQDRDLARDLIRLSGLAEDQVPIVYTGLRAGERLHESLSHDTEITERTGHDSIMRVRANAVGVVGEELEALLGELEARRGATTTIESASSCGGSPR